jgi:peptide deformylase
MTILNILHYPDPRLNAIAVPVKQVDNTIRQIVDDLAASVWPPHK